MSEEADGDGRGGGVEIISEDQGSRGRRPVASRRDGQRGRR
jgi:hypothetical protein